MYTMDDAREDLMHEYCTPCGEFKFPCEDCGMNFCLYCESCECEED